MRNCCDTHTIFLHDKWQFSQHDDLRVSVREARQMETYISAIITRLINSSHFGCKICEVNIWNLTVQAVSRWKEIFDKFFVKCLAKQITLRLG